MQVSDFVYVIECYITIVQFSPRWHYLNACNVDAYILLHLSEWLNQPFKSELKSYGQIYN